MDRYCKPRHSPIPKASRLSRRNNIPKIENVADTCKLMDIPKNSTIQDFLTLREDMIKEWKREYFEMKLRKLYASQIVNSKVALGLRYLTKNLLREQKKLNGFRDYMVVQGRPMTLEYKNASIPESQGDKVEPTSHKFGIDIDVRGYMPEYVSVETEDSSMTVRAKKVNGKYQKSLIIMGLTPTMVNRLIVHPPKNGVLTICSP